MISQKTASQLISELNEIDETEHLEAKEMSADSTGKSVFETICSMSNEPELGGGTIVLGIQKEESLFAFYSASGVADPDKISADIASGCASKFNIPVRVNIKTEKVGEVLVVRVDVPELPKHQKPLCLKGQGLPRGAFRRIGPTDVRCTEEDLVAFYQDKVHDTHDYMVVPEATLEDIDDNAVKQYRRARAEANRLAEELNWSDTDLLLSLGALRRVSGEMRVTTTGVMTFGTSAALRRLFPTHRVDYIRIPGTSWVGDPQGQFDSLDMRGSIITLIPRVIAAILDDLPKALRIEDGRSGQRTEISTIPQRVVREAVVNALMHRNYQVHQPIQIVRYANRIAIKNPGYSLKSQERFDDPGSLIRNPHVAEILHETRFAETKGSGIRVMRQKMAESGLSPPAYVSDRDNDDFEAIFLFHHFLNESDWKWLAAFRDLDLNDDHKRALIFVREVGAIDNQSYRSLVQTDTTGATRALRKLKTLLLLEDRGGGARTHYVAGPELVKQLSIHASEPLSMDAKPDHIANEESPEIAFGQLPQRLKVQVKSAQIKRRLDPDITKHLIFDLCNWRPLSAAELALLLDKAQTYISQRFLAPMVSEGLLRYTHPEMIQHPKQKYTTVD